MKVKTSTLTGRALDYVAAQCAIGDGGYPVYMGFYLDGSPNKPHWGESGSSEPFQPSARGDHCVAIINTDEIATYPMPGGVGGRWRAERDGRNLQAGPTMAVAAMRCYVASRLGDEVDVPEELT